MEIKGYTVEDSEGGKYWVAAETTEEAIAMVQEDLDRGSCDDITVLADSVTEIDVHNTTVFDENMGTELSIAEEIRMNGVGLIACTEW